MPGMYMRINSHFYLADLFRSMRVNDTVMISPKYIRDRDKYSIVLPDTYYDAHKVDNIIDSMGYAIVRLKENMPAAHNGSCLNKICFENYIQYAYDAYTDEFVFKKVQSFRKQLDSWLYKNWGINNNE